MRHKELVDRKLDDVQGHIQRLRFIVQRGEPVEKYLETLENLQNIVEDIQSTVRREGMEPTEGNGLY
jgi:hypothetical protein